MGITKTRKRMRHNYSWSGMKTEIQKFIPEYRNCQLEQLVRVKLYNPWYSPSHRIPRSIRSQWIS